MKTDKYSNKKKEKFFPKFPFNKHTYPVSHIAMIPNLARTEMSKNRKGGNPDTKDSRT